MRKQGALSFPEAVRKIAQRYNIPIKEIGFKPRKERSIEIKKTSLEYNEKSEFRGEILKILDLMQGIYFEELKSNSSLGAKRARDYLEQRRISEKTIEKFGIGYSPSNDVYMEKLKGKTELDYPKLVEVLFRAGVINGEGYRAFTNRIMLPLKNLEQEIIGFNSRLTNNKKRMKYKNTGNRELFSNSSILYGLELINAEKIRKQGLSLVEGHLDLFGFEEQEMENCLGIGTSLLSEGQIDRIKKLEPRGINLFTDGDSPSVVSSIKNSCAILEENFLVEEDISIISMPENKDPFDVFYFEKKSIPEHISRNSYSLEEFILSQRSFEAFETKTRSGVENLTEIAGPFFGGKRLNRILLTLLEN